jgi:hypothetical protein
MKQREILELKQVSQLVCHLLLRTVASEEMVSAEEVQEAQGQEEMVL